jgi:hypothetical protein
MPLSPSFPDWLLKRDPTLAGALTNPLFLAFEERRKQRWSSKWGAFAASPSRVIAAAVPLICGIVAFEMFGVSLELIWATSIGGVLVAGIVGKGFLMRRSEMNLVPSYLRDAIWPNPFLPVLRGLWVTPNAPETYAEAILLESRLENHVAAGIVPFLGAFFISGFWILSGGWAFSSLDRLFANAVLATAILVLLIRIAPPLYWAMNVDQLGHVYGIITGLGGDVHVPPRGAQSLSAIFKGCLWFAGLSFFSAICSLLMWAVWTSVMSPLLGDMSRWLLRFEHWRTIHEIVAYNHVQFAITVNLILPIYFTGPFTRHLRTSFENSYPPMLARMGNCIPPFFDRILEP